jgi:uncharacterized protein YggE
MRSAAVAITTLLAGFLLANMLGVAVAEAPAPTAPRTISVEGVASVPIGQADNAASATAVYRQGMAGAVADGQSKAEFLAGKVSATLGAVQSLGEGGGEISCTASEASGYAEYEGEQPDFGSVSQGGVTYAAAPKAAHVVKPRSKSKSRPVAKKASVGSCTLTARVSVVYAIS